MRRDFHVVDVFTHRPFGGNPLAVFPDGREISDSAMQRIAREFNLSETTFVLPPEDAANDHRVRIFTPYEELPMAGHPTVGTALVLARLAAAAGRPAPLALRLEEKVGLVPVDLDWTDGEPVRATMQQPLPSFGPIYEDRAALAACLSLREADLATGPAQIVSCGVDFLFVPLRNLAAAGRARLRLDLWGAMPPELAHCGVYVFTQDCQSPDARAHGRMFGPHFGIPEDPATGGAAGPLGCYLLHHRLLDAEVALDFVVEQGIEMGRPSQIEVSIEAAGSKVSSVRVGGACVAMSEGEFTIPE